MNRSSSRGGAPDRCCPLPRRVDPADEARWASVEIELPLSVLRGRDFRPLRSLTSRRTERRRIPDLRWAGVRTHRNRNGTESPRSAQAARSALRCGICEPGEVSAAARAETRNREVHLPPVSVYRWWARRTEAVNGAILDCASQDHPGERMLVADPFAGGAIIPLAAVIRGHQVYAQDLNPWAALWAWRRCSACPRPTLSRLPARAWESWPAAPWLRPTRRPSPTESRPRSATR